MKCSLLATVSAVAICASAARGDEEEAVSVYHSVQGSVVALENIEGSGTGILLDATGLILTNAHVVASPLPYKCKADVRRGGKPATATFAKVKIVGIHSKFDLALVRIDPTEHPGALQPAHIARRKAEPGQRVYAIGNPGGGGMVLNKTITSGILSGVDRVIDGVAYYQISAPINPGNSGGPLCDKGGQVLGLVTLKFTDVENVGFAIPLDGLKSADFVPLAKRKADPARSRELIRRAQKLCDESQSIAKRKGASSAEAKLFAAYAAYYYHLALLSDPGNDSLYYNVGMLLRQIDEDEAATAYLLQAIEIKPWCDDDAIYYRELGFSLIKQKKAAEALAAWEEGLAKFPKTAAKIWEDMAIYNMTDSHDYYRAAYAAAMVGRLAAPNTRLPIAASLLRDATGRLESKRKAQLDAAVAKITEDLRHRQAAADKAHAAGRSYLTSAFAEYMKNEGHLGGKEKPAAASAEPKLAADIPADEPAGDKPQVGRPALDLAVPEGSVDLLRQIDLVKGAVQGHWTFAGAALATPVTGFARLQIPAAVPDEYDLTLIVERKSNRKEFVVGLVRGGAQTALVIDGAGGQATGFDPTGPGAYHGAVLQGGPVTLVCKVRREGLMLTADGKRIFLERSAEAFPAVPDDWKVSDETALFVGTNSTRCLVHKMMLTPYKRPAGKGPS